MQIKKIIKEFIFDMKNAPTESCHASTITKTASGSLCAAASAAGKVALSHGGEPDDDPGDDAHGESLAADADARRHQRCGPDELIMR